MERVGHEVGRQEREAKLFAEVTALDSLRRRHLADGRLAPAFSIRWYRNARTRAFTNAELARVVTGATPSAVGVKTVFLPGRRRMASGTRTVMLVTVVVQPPSAHLARWR